MGFSMSIEPAKPVFSVDGTNLDELPPELREGLERFYSEQEIKKEKLKQQQEREYQALLADTLCACAPRYVELETDPEESVLIPWLQVNAGVALFPPAISVHQFYFDLYGIEAAPTIDPSEAYNIMREFEFDELVTGDEVDDLPEDRAILVNHRDRQPHPFQIYRNFEQFIHGIGEGETSFIYTGHFWIPTNKKTGERYLTARRNAMLTIGAFCVDIDRVDDSETGDHFSADWVMSTLVECFDAHPEIEPNYLNLTGTGIQLWYVFGRQIPLLSAKRSPRRDKFGKVLKLLYAWFADNLPKNRFKVDEPCATICHAFRAPGSAAKLHYPTRMFIRGGFVRPLIDPLELSRFLGGPLEPYDTEDWNEEAYRRLRAERKSGREQPASEKQLAWLAKLESMGCIESVSDDITIAEADEAIKRAEIVFTKHRQFAVGKGFIDTTSGHHVVRHMRDPKLYFYTLKRIVEETPTGTRYNALFGLAGLAWNCGIPKARLRQDMEALLGTSWAAKLSTDRNPLQMKDIKNAMEGYNELGALRPRAALERRLEWSYGPPQKRNGRTRQEHLWGEWKKEDGVVEVNTAKANRELSHAHGNRKRCLDRLAQHLKKEPSSTKRAACVALGMSATTVVKYWQEACEIAGVADIRSGNHSPM